MQKFNTIDYKTIQYEIARLDRLIIFSFAQRLRYKELAQIIETENNNFTSVADFNLTLEQRKLWAINAGLNPDVINKFAQYLIDYYLIEEKCSRNQLFNHD